MEFKQEVPDISTFPIRCPPQGSQLKRSHGYLMAQSLFQTELPGEDMVRHANMFLETHLSQIVTSSNMKATSINAQNNRKYTIHFNRCYVSPPFYTDPQNNKSTIQLTLEKCRKLRVPYNLGVWVDIEFKVRTYTVIPPLRSFRRHTDCNCFYAPCLFLDATSTNPSTSTTGFACTQKITDGAQKVYNTRLDLVFEPNVLSSFHEEYTKRQNANSANVVDVETYTTQLWSHTVPRQFEKEIWSFRKKPTFHMLIKNLVMIGTYNTHTRVFTVKTMGKKSILRGKVTRTKPPYIEQHDLLFEHESIDLIPNVLLLQLPCMVGSSICNTRRTTHEPFRYDSSIMHSGTCERVVMRNVDFKSDVCYVKALANNVYEGVLRSTHDIRKSHRSTSATSVFVTASEIYIVLPFLTKANDHQLKIHIVEFIKLMLDEPIQPNIPQTSNCTTLHELLDILCLASHTPTTTTTTDTNLRSALEAILLQPPCAELLGQPRSKILARLGRLGSRQVSTAKQIHTIVHTIHQECLPHLGVHGTVQSRRYKLFHVIRDILHPTMKVFMNKNPPTDIHSLKSKQVNGYSNIIGVMFRQTLGRFLKNQLKSLYDKTRGNVVIDAPIIHAMFDRIGKLETSINYGYKTGNVQPSQKKKGNKAKAEKKPQPAIENVLSANIEGKIGTVRRFHVAYSKNNYSSVQRLVHPSQWHFVCPAEVPEGERCGLVMNFCLGVRTSVGYMDIHDAFTACSILLASFPVTIFPSIYHAKDFDWFDHTSSCVSSPSSSVTTSLLYVNHVIAGILDVSCLEAMLIQLRMGRETGLFHFEVSIYVQDNDIRIETQKGRLVRCLLRTKFVVNGVFDQVFHRCMDTRQDVWKVLVEKHIVEFYSIHEIESRLLPIVAAPSPQEYYKNQRIYTHVEVEQMFMFSNMAANGTLQSRNQCVRTSYACKHRSQAAAHNMYTDSAPENSKLSLDYPQHPLVESVANRMTHHTMQLNPSTECFYVIINDKQSNEDGIIVNKSFIERGGLNVTKTHGFHAQAKAHHFIRIPPKHTQGMKAANYSKLDPLTGIVKPGTRVEFNDVLAGIVFKDTKTSSVPVYLDKSIIYSMNMPGLITKVEAMRTKYGIESYTITVQLTSVTQLQVGDKLASPYSQKSVVVAIVPEHEMPTVAYGPNAGMAADLSFNCHGIPTRMTGATTDAPLLGLYAVQFGKRINGTAFEMNHSDSKDQFARKLGSGKIWMRNPQTGQIYPEKIFMGVSSYMRLNHLVAEKCHARNGGPVDNFQQPKAGRANKGGLRIGKMERIAIEGHGAAEFTYERMFVMSDRSVAYICKHCSSVNGDPPLPGQNRGLCRSCNDPISCFPVEIPYSTICLLNYFKGAGVPLTLTLEPDEDAVDAQSARPTQYKTYSLANTSTPSLCINEESESESEWTSQEEDED